jgi:spore germination protein YaaH
VSSKALSLTASVLTALVAGAALAVPAASAAPAAAPAAAPTRPGPLTVAKVGQTGAVVDFGRSAGRVRYRVLANGKAVATTRRTSRVRIPLACGRTYVVAAVAVDARGRRSAPSPSARLRTRACTDRQAPAAPARLTAPARTDTTVELRWPADKAANRAAEKAGVTGYLVYRDGTVLGGATGRAYVARSLRPSTSYTFSVRARDAAGNLSKPVSLAVTTAAPTQSTGDVRAYVLTSDDGSFADAQAHYQQLDRVFPTFFDMTAIGDVVGTGRPVLTRWFQDRGVRVMPRFHTEDPAVIEAIVADPATRSYAAQQIAQVVAAGGYDGANLDFEMGMPATGVNELSQAQRWDRLRDGYSDLVDEVSARVHAAGGLVSVAVSPNWCSAVDPATRATTYCTDSSSTSTRRSRAYLFDYERIAAAADEVWVMAWGLHWASSDSGPVADVRWLSAVTDYYADLFADRPAMIGKLTLGTNLYAMDWSEYVVRTDRISWPGTPYPTAPTCPDSSRTARARTSYEGTPGEGTLVIDWVCLTRVAVTWEHSQVNPAEFTAHAFDEASAEHVLTAPDPVRADAQRVLWYVDRATIARRAALAAGRHWRLGFWRLGREDQQIWTLPALTDGSLS